MEDKAISQAEAIKISHQAFLDSLRDDARQNKPESRKTGQFKQFTGLEYAKAAIAALADL